MKISILVTVCSMFLFSSCKSQTFGLYVGEFDSGVKYLSNSTIELKDENQFELTYSLTSLESTIPSTPITRIEGKFKIDKDHLILFPVSKKVNSNSIWQKPRYLKFKPKWSKEISIS